MSIVYWNDSIVKILKSSNNVIKRHIMNGCHVSLANKRHLVGFYYLFVTVTIVFI